ncbi:MAG: thiamine phosphate synthase [Solirubrobacteraceae bacterium]|nr:thiamine phosphate synthase [Solirubrobacteraceae bacterium]
MTPERRRDRFRPVRLYLVAPLEPGGRPLVDVATAAIAGGVDALQVRDKHADDAAIVAAVRALRPLCDATGTLLMVNDRPDLAVAGGADGVHVGQDDVAVAEARRVVGDGRLVGLSTHAPDEVDAAVAEGVVDHIGVGPVHATPTKAGRPAVGVALVRHAAARSLPFVAIGGIDATNADAVLTGGAPRIAVVRAITDAPDPRTAAAALRALVDARRERDPADGARTA